MIAQGSLFTHHSRLDTTWKPDVRKGEKYADAPHEIMEVFRVTKATIWFGPVGASKSDTHMSRAAFEEEYGRMLTVPEAVAELKALLDTDDAERVHSEADRTLLDAVPGPLRDAYRQVQDNASFWATA